jgi:hypothetical protein
MMAPDREATRDGPIEGERLAMDWAKGLAGMSSTRRLALVLGLTVCATDSGCARTRSFLNGTPPPPMFGADNSSTKGAGGKTAGGSDLYAQNARRPGSPNGPAGGPSPPSTSRDLAVALQSPVTVAPAREPAIVAATEKPARPATASASALPGPIEATPTASATPPERPAAVAGAAAEPTAESLVASARARLDALASYQVDLNRQERVGEALLEPEDVLLSIRRNPRAVRLEWLDGPHKGREVIYAADQNGGLMHVNMADSVVPVPRMSMPPDSPLVLKSSRHPITEAGLDNVVADLEKTIALTGKGDTSRGRLSYGGLENPGPLERPCHKLVRITPSGETWHVYLDPETKLPAMVQATDLQGELLERYVFRNPRPDPPALASADAFDPDKRWGPATGLLGRLARARGSAAPQ